jgi:CheY-like chemotaxis protein
MDLPRILIVEDNGDDVALIRRAFKHCQIVNPLSVVSDGDAAVAYLSGTGPYADRAEHPLPALVMLDLKLPRRSGLEVLEWMKQQPLLKRTPVVILTSSKEHKDVNRAYDLGANSYLMKPVEFDELRAMVERLHLYWLVMNESPDMHVPG